MGCFMTELVYVSLAIGESLVISLNEQSGVSVVLFSSYSGDDFLEMAICR